MIVAEFSVDAGKFLCEKHTDDDEINVNEIPCKIAAENSIEI
jgi:hypothetical protein